MFQSYLIYGQSPSQLRKKTIEIAKGAGIRLKTNSPDIFTISPIKKSITIDQIRSLKSHIAQKPLKERYKLVILEDAHQLTHEAQNALLKTLEEPPSHAIIILEAKNYQSLLPTILSRVVKIRTHSHKPKLGVQPLIEVEPLTALETISQIKDPQEFLDNQIVSLTKLLTDTISSERGPRLLAVGEASDSLSRSEEREDHGLRPWESISTKSTPKGNPNSTRVKKLSRTDLVAAIEKCLETKKMINANVNPKFALANLIFSLNLHPSN